MPGMTGLDLAKTVRELWPDCRLIILTAYADFNYAREAIELGVFSYILKTDSDEHIMEVIDTALKQIYNSLCKTDFYTVYEKNEPNILDLEFIYPILAVLPEPAIEAGSQSSSPEIINDFSDCLRPLFTHYFRYHSYTIICNDSNKLNIFLKREKRESELFDIWLGETLETIQHVFEKIYCKRVTFIFSDEIQKVNLEDCLNQMCQFAINTSDHLGYVYQYRDNVYNHQDFVKSILDGITEYIETNIFGDLSLSILSHVTGYSASYLSRFFLKYKSENLSKYISRRKLVHIRHLMRSPKFSLNDIAERSGFESRSYFNRFIKRLTGMTPQEFRDSKEP